MARGRLTRPADEATPRLQTDDVGKRLYDRSGGQDRPVIQAVQDLAARRGAKMAQIALAWVLAKPQVTAPIIGASKIGQLEDAVGALDVALDADEIAALEAPYVPHAISGHE